MLGKKALLIIIHRTYASAIKERYDHEMKETLKLSPDKKDKVEGND